MATDDINIVDPDNGSGTNYTSLNLWEDGEESNLVSADIVAIAKCRCTGGTADASFVTIDGWTTDANRHIKIWTDPTESYRHPGKLSTADFRLSVNNWESYNMLIQEDFVLLDGLQFICTGSGKQAILKISELSSGAKCIIQNSIFTITGGVSSYGVSVSPVNNVMIICCNSLFYNLQTGYRTSDWTESNHYIYNCTFENCSSSALFVYGTGNQILKNCLFSSCAADCINSLGDLPTASYCATTNNNTNGLQSDGIGNRFSQTFTFLNESGDDFHLASGDSGAKGYGTNLTTDAIYAFSTDIDGETRPSSGAWCIGADEYIAAAKAVFQYLFKNRFRHMAIR